MISVFRSAGISLLALILLMGSSTAQTRYVQVSPAASAVQTVGITDITVTYHRPGVKGRVIWGELVPYDQIWRTGANNATTIEFSTEVNIAGTKIAAGKYSLFTIPGREEWTIIINKNTTLWGAFDYKQEEDLLRFNLKPQAAENQEWMIFTFENLSKNSADLVLRWEKIKIPITVSVNTDDLVLNGFKADLGWQTGNRAASYCLENNVDLDHGKKWIDLSLTVEKNYWNLTTKARYLALDKNYKEAVKTLQAALDLGKKMEQQPWNYEQTEKLLQEWKSKI
jgi:hypothetical protein